MNRGKSLQGPPRLPIQQIKTVGASASKSIAKILSFNCPGRAAAKIKPTAPAIIIFNRPPVTYPFIKAPRWPLNPETGSVNKSSHNPSRNTPMNTKVTAISWWARPGLNQAARANTGR